MAVLYRPGLCEKCERPIQNEKFCIRGRKTHAIRRRLETINGVRFYGPYLATCEEFSPKEVE